MQNNGELTAELIIKRSASKDLEFAIEHGVKTAELVDDDQAVVAEFPVISFNPSAPAGQRFRFDTTRADEIKEFKDRTAETGAIIKRILGERQ